MEILQPILIWCTKGLIFTIGFLIALAAALFILLMALTGSEKIRLYAIGGSVLMIPTIIATMVQDRNFLCQHWVVLPLLAALLALSLYIAYTLDEMEFSFWITILKGIGIFLYGTFLILLFGSLIAFAIIAICGEDSRYRRY